jgi:hypothetical protein
VACHEPPQRYGLLVTVPLTREQFLADATNGRKEFVRQWVASLSGYAPEQLWRDYERIAGFTLQIVSEAREAGVQAVTDGCYGSWTAMAATSDVITLVAHWVAGPPAGFEYADGPRPLDEVVDALPEDFGGIIDLTVCHSTNAIPAFKKARPRCSVLANREPARLDLRLAMYRQILRLVRRERQGYIAAAQRVHLAALEQL